MHSAELTSRQDEVWLDACRGAKRNQTSLVRTFFYSEGFDLGRAISGLSCGRECVCVCVCECVCVCVCVCLQLCRFIYLHARHGDHISHFTSYFFLPFLVYRSCRGVCHV